MKKLNSLALITLFAVALWACKDLKNASPSAADHSALLLLGDSVATAAQQILLKNVSAAMAQGGPEYAVDFCHMKATPLIDSLSAAYNVTIQRLSDKNRNPENAIQSQTDITAWDQLIDNGDGFIHQDENGARYFYKPIMIGMPACLSCHGRDADITPATREVLSRKYPDDKAIGYALGDIRGMWKIKMPDLR